jgi:hypothetical protein
MRAQRRALVPARVVCKGEILRLEGSADAINAAEEFKQALEWGRVGRKRYTGSCVPPRRSTRRTHSHGHCGGPSAQWRWSSRVLPGIVDRVGTPAYTLVKLNPVKFC